MFSEIFRFELRYQLRQPLFWISAFFFFLLTFLAVTTEAVSIGGSIGRVHRNAPFVIMPLLLVMSIMGTFVTTAFVASTVLRDFDFRTQELFFTSPVSKGAYLFGRFFGALTASIGIYLFVVFAIILGSAMPWLEPERVGPFSLVPYLFSMIVIVVPNVIFTACVFFSLATLTRSLMATYAGLVAMFFGYALAGNLLSDIENERLASIIDPFGSGALGIATKYWTVVERNTQVLALDNVLVTNRLLWLGVAFAVLALTYVLFSFTYIASRKAKRKREEIAEPVSEPPVRITKGAPVPFTAWTGLGQLLHKTGMEIRGVVRSAAFPTLLAFGVFNMIGNSTVIDQLFGTAVHPVTHVMVTILQSGSLFILIILIVYSGEIVWRERSLGVSEVEDALPAPNWVFWGSKMAALVFVLASVLATAVITGIGIQAYHGYTHFELDVYLKGMFLIFGVQLVLSAVLAVFLQVVAYNKYVGFLLMILFIVGGPALSALDFNHNLYFYGGVPNAPYSDMNGYGHFVKPVFFFSLYWSFFAVLLLCAVHLLWPRGSESGMRLRLRLAADRLTGTVKAVTALTALAFLSTGAYVFYNTNILNEYVPGDLQEERQARFERDYKQYEGIPQPRITAVYTEVDLFPETRGADIRGTYSLENKTGEPIEVLHVVLSTAVDVRAMDIPDARKVEEDDELGFTIYELEKPLEPGGTLEMQFDLSVTQPGFVNHGSNTNLVQNGTFINNVQYFPHLGYSRAFELQDPNDRRTHGLAAVQRMPEIDDEAARLNNYISTEADWIDFETIVSTTPDQIAMAPGYLQREWEEGGRRYFHYKMDAPILGFFGFLSADWEVAQDEWEGVSIEIYHHPEHTFNVDRMIDAVKKSLDYFTEEFGPYQHRQLRILEFPRYARFAQSLPNTIPFSESIGFIAKLDEEDDEAIDYVFYVTAHEVAHQWWAHQVIGGGVQGATVMSETMSQYSALMVMEKEYGPEKMRRFLKYELDSYLRGRGGELIEELPLLLVENQPYIHYRKGSLIMYALRDYIGEDVLNDAMKRYVEAVKFQDPPYTYAREFLAYVKEATPENKHAMLEDFFENITVYDNRATSASYEKREDGRYAVRLNVEAKKYHADGDGTEREVMLADEIDVGVFGEDDKVLYLEKRRMEGDHELIEVIVDEEPHEAGIDPYNKLIDRNPEDNMTRVTTLTEEG